MSLVGAGASARASGDVMVILPAASSTRSGDCTSALWIFTATTHPHSPPRLSAWPSSAGTDGRWDGDGGGRADPGAARAEPDLESYEAEAEGGGQRGDGYDQGYDHGHCRGSGCDDGGRYERYEDGYRAGYDEAGVRDDQSEYDDGDADDPGYERWYYEESYGDAEDHGGGPWSGAAA